MSDRAAVITDIHVLVFGHTHKPWGTIERVADDAPAAAAQVREAGLPGEYADKLLVAA